MQLPSERRRRSVDRWKEGEAPQDAVAERIQAKRIAQEQRQQARREACEAKPSTKGAVMESLKDSSSVVRDAGLINIAVRRRWGITEEQLTKLPEMLGDIANNKRIKVTARVAAARTLVGMERQNQLDQHKAIDKTIPDPPPPPDVERADPVAVANQMLDDPDYIEYQRQRAIAADSDSGSVR